MKKKYNYIKLFVKVILPSLLLISIPVVIICFFIFGADFKSLSETKNTSVILNASTTFNGTQFIIKNSDSFDYLDAVINVNKNYYLKGVHIKEGEALPISIVQFADDNGNRFTFLQKPQRISIFCKTSEGKDGFYDAEW